MGGTSQINPKDLDNKVVDTGLGLFRVITAMALSEDEWSLVGFHLNSDMTPQTNHAQHLSIDPVLLSVVEVP